MVEISITMLDGHPTNITHEDVFICHGQYYSACKNQLDNVICLCGEWRSFDKSEPVV